MSAFRSSPPRTWLLLLPFSLPAMAFAQEPVVVEPLIITAPRTSSGWLQTPAAVGAVEAADVQGEQRLTLDRLLAPVPGVLTQDRYNFAQGMRLSIRGFGARASFGTRGVRVLVDGVPLTMPDGQTELDGLDLGLVERLEVLRGPASTLYGNAAGGVLLIETREPPAVPYALVDLSGGELGYRRAQVEAGASQGDLGALFAVSRTELDGYRAHNRAETLAVTGKLNWYASAGQLGLTLNAIDNRTEDPGGLRIDEVRADRDRAAPNNLLFDGDESVRQQRMALSWKGRAPGEDDYLVRAWYGRRDFANRLPFEDGGQAGFDRDFAGLGTQYTHRAQWFGMAHQLTAGVDLEAQRDDRTRHDNLQGTRGVRTGDQEEKVDSWALFVEDEIALSERWLATLGLRYDEVRIEVDDRFVTATDPDESGSRRLDDWNYSAGLSYRLDAHHRLYARVATSFETPTNNELANPAGGGFNPSLGPAQALNREVGLKGEWDDLRYEAVLYSVRVEDELVPFTLPDEPGRTYYRNAGESRRDGVELSLDWRFAPRWALAAAYSYNDYRYVDYRLDDEVFDDNALPGIARHALFTELQYEYDGWYTRVNANAYGRQYADDANQTRIGGYALYNLRVGKRLAWAGQEIEPYLGIDNLTGRDYYDNIRINAAAGRYFEPAPGRTLYAGVKLTF
ncbi:TonB-dependent receptor family protein [Stutzerimonas azotifigens]|uniref:TonB-dependent receptor family protein n=1 Tax=Stutzerimonas azotifigens TaxID=291995 RepID=UPI0003F81F10|nr:TonB-dependent receptor [Stutzerimonas azotifigens]